jgi:hypothetical protein
VAVAIPNASLRAQARADSRDDLGELRFLCDGAALDARHPLRRELDRGPGTAADRDRIALALRREYALRAALATAGEWQSPPIGAGIRVHVNDYRRDRHADAVAYEAAYVRELGAARGVRAFATSCGMAALTTILAFLDLDGPVLLGRASYHETKELVHRFCAGALEIDEPDLPLAVETLRPAAVFVDSLCNSRGLAVPPLQSVLARADCWVVVDNTCLGPRCRPFDSPAPRLLVWESLLKLAQFGLDRANAGILLARGPGTARLDALREHLGTNVSDTAVLSLPPPERARLERRVGRLERNAALLAERLGGHYPGVGPLLELDVADPRRWVDRALDEARRRDVRVVHGTSFGFDHTRVYLTAAGPGSFLRIAAGTEDRLRIETVADALGAAA